MKDQGKGHRVQCPSARTIGSLPSDDQPGGEDIYLMSRIRAGVGGRQRVQVCQVQITVPRGITTIDWALIYTSPDGGAQAKQSEVM